VREPGNLGNLRHHGDGPRIAAYRAFLAFTAVLELPSIARRRSAAFRIVQIRKEHVSYLVIRVFIVKTLSCA